MMKCVQRRLTVFVFGAGLAFTVTGIFFTLTTLTVSKVTQPGTVCSTNCTSVGNTNTNVVIHTVKAHTDKHLHIFNATIESTNVRESVSKHKCIPYKTRSGETSICVHPPEKDVHISGRLLRFGRWESRLVDLTANALSAHPGMSFLDIGCNIGTFTVYMAKLGTRVVGIDASMENLLLLSRSLSLGKLHQNVTLILNAVSDTHQYVTLQEVTKNKGGRFVIPSKKSHPGAVKTITLDELAYMFNGESIFIKMDIEGSEWKTLKGGKQFFKKVDVRFVLMEFMFHKKKQSGKHMCDFFTENGFRPYRSLKRIKGVMNISQYQSWPVNVLWIKE